MNKKCFQQINDRLSRVDSLEKKRDALIGLSFAVILICILLLISAVTESIFKFDSETRTIIFYFSTLIILVVSIKSIFIPLLKSFSIFYSYDELLTAEKVGSSFPEIKDELLNALQLIKSPDTNYSSELIAAAFERIYKITNGLVFTKSVSFSEVNRKARLASIVFLFTLLLFLIVPGLGSSAYRVINFSQDFTIPQKFVFIIEPGNYDVAKGEDVLIKIAVSGEKPTSVSLKTKSSDQTEFEEKILSADSNGAFIFKAVQLKNSFEYFAEAENIQSELYKISVINRPIITNFELTINPPTYSKLPQIVQRDNGNLTVLPGTKVLVKLNSSHELYSASVLFNDSTKNEMVINETSAKTEFRVTKELDYSLRIMDKNKKENINPITYSIQLINDASPSIELTSPKKNVKLGLEGKISISAKIKDDFGFGGLYLNYKLTASKYREVLNDFSKIPIPINNNLLEDEVFYLWDLAPLFLAEGEALSFYLEIFDNDVVSGPKSTKTEMITVLVPSMDEIFQAANNSEEEISKDLSETFKDAEKLNSELHKIANDLKQNSKEISWQEKERMERASQKFQELLNKTDDISNKLNEMQKDLMQNNLLSEETLQKYNELQDLLDQFSSEELQAAFKKLQESLQSLLRDNIQMSFDQLKANEEYFKKSLERTINLLKRVQIEQKLDELIKRAEEISEKLEDLSSKTKESNIADKNKRSELSSQQNDITSKLERLAQEMKDIEKKMSELSDMPKEEIEKLMSEFEKQNNEELSEQIKKELEQMQKMEALKNQTQLSENMQSSKNMMQGLQAAMMQMNQMRTFYEMMKILDDLLSLSKEQEAIKNRTNDAAPLSLELKNYTNLQNEIQNNLGKVLQKMSALSQKTFAITPEMGKAMGKALSEMQQSITWMQNGNAPLASQKQTEAMKNLNEAASLLKGGMDQMMSGGQRGGMMSMMQQLQMMAQQQMNLNQLTQMMNGGQASQEMMAQMQRLAQQQELIRKSLEQLNREAKESGESKRLAANLEKILDEMKEVVTNLQSEKLDDSLIKQQERILAKLLDAQRSINERDFEKERRSNTGQNVARVSPSELKLDSEEAKNKLRDELLKAIREGYKKDYQELIRKYFETLETSDGKK